MTLRRRGGKARAATLSPADVHSRTSKSPRRATVGGRVVGVTGREVLLADALWTVRVSLEPGQAPGLEAGTLLTVEGILTGKHVERARVIALDPGAPPTGTSEFGRLALDGIGPLLRARSIALECVRRYFAREGFLEVETPVRVPSPGLDAHVDALSAEDGYLITSPELHMKRLLVGGLPRVYQLSRVSRANENGPLHETEFTMLEWYRAFSGMDAMIVDTEQLILAVVRKLSRSGHAWSPDGRRVDVKPPFRRITMREAFREHAGIEDAAALAKDDPDAYFRAFVERVEPGLSRESRAIVLTEFPITEAALARPCPHDPTVAERFEVYAGGVELCNGFGELTDPAEQRRRFELEALRRERAGSPAHPIDERFLAALAEGMPPSGGNALGFDRLVAVAVGTPTIANVMCFPRDRV